MEIYNSLSNQKEQFTPLKAGEVSMYTCGPTVYNYAHIGNFFAYLSADTLYRWLKYGEGHDVKWVMNITDIDDKTIRDSKEKHPDEDPMQALNNFCGFYADEFLKDLKKLNITGIAEHPRATHYIEAQQDLVTKLHENGFAYISDGSVYFDIAAYKKAGYDYGRLVHIDEGFQAGARVDQDEYEKASAADFVLWKGYKEGEPFWDFELDGQDLKGRPGWHLECSAMEKEIFGLPFDIHTGGVDLKFPHHEDEIAQSHGGYGSDPTKVWVHNGHLMVEGEKMSKSKGNFFRLRDLTEDQGWDAEVVRLAMVTNHYRGSYNFTQNGLNAAKKNIKEIRDLYSVTGAGGGDISQVEKYKVEFAEAMQDDINTPKAWGVVLECMKEFKSVEVLPESLKEFLDLASNVFGVDFKPQEVAIPAEVVAMVEQHKQAKADKDFETADKLRDELKEKGFMWDQRKGEIVKL